MTRPPHKETGLSDSEMRVLLNKDSYLAEQLAEVEWQLLRVQAECEAAHLVNTRSHRVAFLTLKRIRKIVHSMGLGYKYRNDIISSKKVTVPSRGHDQDSCLDARLNDVAFWILSNEQKR